LNPVLNKFGTGFFILDMHKNLFHIASALMILGIILGAFGAHFLKNKVSHNLIEAYKTGVFYHLIHGMAIFALSISVVSKIKMMVRGAYFLLAGILLFSGSLYLLSIKEMVENQEIFRFIGKLTPIGGVSLIIGWTIIFLSAKKWAKCHFDTK